MESSGINMTENKSIVKTDKALRKAFCEFLGEDGYYVPTVQQLVDRAEISKPTFYRRYENIENFIESEISFAVNSVCENVQRFEKALEEQRVSAKKITANFDKNASTVQLIQALIHSQYFYDYSKRLMQQINRVYNEKDYVKAMTAQEKGKYMLYISIILSHCYICYPKDSIDVVLDYLCASRDILLQDT